jgi:ribosomal protein S18 acetylase RimI-like enzyme
MPNATFTIRPMTKGDLPAVGKLAGALVRMHHAADPRRFLLVDGVEQGYARYFGSQLGNEDVVLLAAVNDANGAVVGYAYGALEDRDWNMLLDAHGALHDVFVAEEARRASVGERLVRDTCAHLEKKGAPRVLLSTMVSNTAAQRLFEKCGFRSTMIEMTKEKGA